MLFYVRPLSHVDILLVIFYLERDVLSKALFLLILLFSFFSFFFEFDLIRVCLSNAY